MTWVDDSNAALLTDMYELTMGASYLAHDLNHMATFDLFVRDLPPRRNFLVACGIEQAVDYLEKLHFDDDAIDYLRSLGTLPDDFLSLLAELRFTGELRAVSEGEIVFPHEPIVSVTAPLIEAQLVETFLLNAIGFQTMIATKAARVAIACGDRRFMDMSLRRDHGADAGLKAARASFVGGASSTSNVLAGKMFGIATAGTMAHSYVMAFDDEVDAFRCFVRDFGERSILLIDTYDVEEGARRAARVAKELLEEGKTIRGVRIDSGDVAVLSRSVRKILDDAGLDQVQIVVSGDLDEYRIAELLEEGAPVDSFGVGTQLGTSGDAPWLGGVYKLVDDRAGPKVKLSTGKATLPGRKQVFRFSARECYQRDVIALEDEAFDDARPLLDQVMKDGRRTKPPEPLPEVRERCRRAVAALPKSLRSLYDAAPFPVTHSPRLNALVEKMSRKGASERVPVREVVAVTADLLALSRLRDAADRAQLSLLAARPEQLEGLLRERQPELLIVDLDAGREPLLQALRDAGASGLLPPRTVGFFSHIDDALAAQARDAGCNPIPRGRFWRDLPDLFARRSDR